MILNEYYAGEWWKGDTEAVINQAMQNGGAPNISDAFTFNGLPGPSYNCSAQGTSHPCLTSLFCYFPNSPNYMLTINSFAFKEAEKP